MAGIGLLLDPTSQSSGTQLNIADGTTFALVGEPDFSPPDLEPQWATSSDTEGSLLAATKHQNRTIVIPLRVYGGTATGLDTQLAKLQQKTGKIVREGGTLQLTVPSGKTVVFDLIDAQVKPTINQRYVTNATTDVELRFTAKPYGRAVSATIYSTHSETSKPALVFTETGLAGDVPGLGDLTVTDVQGTDQWLLMWGVQSRYYDSASTAALFYEAETLTPLNASVVTGAPPTSGAGTNNVVRSVTLPSDYIPILSTQATGGGSHLTHVGSFRVYARVQNSTLNADPITVRLDWGMPHGSKTANDPVTINPYLTQGGVASWMWVDLGDVTLEPVAGDPQRWWEGRILAKRNPASAAQRLDVDCLMFVPFDEGSGIVRASLTPQTPATLAARDDFPTPGAGALTGTTAPLGGTYAGGGDTDDFTLAGQRTAVSDAAEGEGRSVWLPQSLTSTVVQTDFKTSALNANLQQGVLARLTNKDNTVRCVVVMDPTTPYLSIQREVSGTITRIAYVYLDPVTVGTWYTLRLLVTASGSVVAWFGPQGQLPTTPTLAGQDSVLATGGTLASGYAGIYDGLTSASAAARSYGNWYAGTATTDSAIFSGLVAIISSKGLYHADPTGTYFTQVPFEGFNLLIPPAWSSNENRTLRMIVKAARLDVLGTDSYAAMPDVAIDDISAQLNYTPRYLVIPE